MRAFQKQYYFIRVLPSTLVGVILSLSRPGFYVLPRAFEIIISLGFLIVIFLKLPYTLRYLYGVLISLLFLLTSFFLGQQANKALRTDQFPIINSSRCALKVLDDPKEKNKTYQITAEIVAHRQSEVLGKKCLVYLSKQGHHSLPNVQDVLFVKARLAPVSSPKNPHQFNYKAYLMRRGIVYQLYIGPKQTIYLFEQEKIHWIRRWRKMVQYAINQRVEVDQQPLAKALLLGQQQALSQEVKTQFQDSGTMHLLAVSGLHVGIIYSLFVLLLQFLPQRNFYNVIKSIGYILGIWLFVFITGAKASTVRAGLMFSIFALGSLHFIRSNSLNVLALIAIILLSIKPQYILDVGFQLSFAAVAGILLLLPHLRSFSRGHPKWIGYFLDLFYLSLAAQLMTLPLILYYFHQFPLYSLATNLIAVPLTFAIVYLGFFTLLFLHIPIINEIVAWLFNQLLQILDELTAWTAQLPGAVIEPLWLDNLVLMSLCLAIILLVMGIKGQGKRWWQYACMFLILCLALSAFDKIQSSADNSLRLYSVPRNTVLEVKQGRQAFIIASEPLDATSYEFFIQANQMANHIKQGNIIPWRDTVIPRILAIRDSIVISQNLSIALRKDIANSTAPTDVVIFKNYSEKENKWYQDKKHQFVFNPNYWPHHYELPPTFIDLSQRSYVIEGKK